MNYQKYADKAYAKIKQYGSPITVQRAGEKEYDKDSNTYTDKGEVFSGYAIQRNFAMRDIDGTNIRMGDVLFMASLSEQPQPDDIVTFKSKTYTVVNVTVLNPDGNTNIFFNIQAR